jgi:hypothetical protein
MASGRERESVEHLIQPRGTRPWEITMAHWRPQKIYCNGCGSWRTNIAHRGCPRGERGSQLFFDLHSFYSGCSKCGETWPLENTRLYCACGYVQDTEYVDAALQLGTEDEIIAVEGDAVYVLRESGVVSIASRTYLDHGYY